MALGVLAATLCAPAGSAAARDSRITYVCGTNLCRVDADGTDRARLTRNGKRGAYLSPTRSLGGDRTSFVRAPSGDFFLADRNARHRRRLKRPEYGQARVQLDRSGRYLLTSRYFASVGEYLTCIVNLRRPPSICHYTGIWSAWGPGRTVLLQAGERDDRVDMFRYGDAQRPTRFVRTVARARTSNRLPGPVALSPNGRYIAVTEWMNYSKDESRIVLFDVRSGRRLRDLTRGRSDELPTFSPDGRSVAFTRYRKRVYTPRPGPLGRSDIWRVSIRGGRATRVVRNGFDPIWGM